MKESTSGGAVFVEGEFNDGGGEGFVADLNEKFFAEFGAGGIDKGHGDCGAQTGGDGATGDFTNFLVIQKDLIVRPGGAFGIEQKTHEIGGWIFHFCRDGGFADKLFFHADEHAARGGVGGAIGGEFVTVERVAHFKAEGIAGTQTAGFDLIVLQQGVPKAGGFGGGEINFVASFAGVSGATDDAGGAKDFEIGGAEIA